MINNFILKLLKAVEVVVAVVNVVVGALLVVTDHIMFGCGR